MLQWHPDAQTTFLELSRKRYWHLPWCRVWPRIKICCYLFKIACLCILPSTWANRKEGAADWDWFGVLYWNLCSETEVSAVEGGVQMHSCLQKDWSYYNWDLRPSWSPFEQTHLIPRQLRPADRQNFRWGWPGHLFNGKGTLPSWW